MRLIDADNLLKILDERLKVYEGKDDTKERYAYMAWLRSYHAIKDAPTIDAVEVVRCGECKHMIPDGRCEEFADDAIRPSVSDFCSYGERRER